MKESLSLFFGVFMDKKVVWGIEGHSFVKKLLEGYLNTNIPHSLIFVGSKDIGKLTMAKKFARILSCTSVKNETPCGACDSCKKKEYDFGEVILIDGDGSISIEEVRNWKKSLGKSDFGGRYRAMIINNPERMTLEGSNAFLKLLEEPGKKIIFILVTSNLDKLLDTIVSRSAILKFDRLSVEDIQNLDEINTDFTAKEMENLLMGRSEIVEKMKDAKKDRLIANVMSFWRLVYGDINDKVLFMNKIKSNNNLILKYVNFWEGCVRDYFIFKNCGKQRCWWQDEKLFSLYSKMNLSQEKLIEFVDDISFIRDNINRGYSKKTLIVDDLVKLYS